MRQPHRLASLILLLGLALVSCGPKTGIAIPPGTESPVQFKRILDHLKLDRPLFLAAPPDGTDRLFIVEQNGRVTWVQNDEPSPEPHLALDIGKTIESTTREEGLLGLAFHPNFKTNHQFFLCFSRHHPRRDVVARFTMD